MQAFRYCSKCQQITVFVLVCAPLWIVIATGRALRRQHEPQAKTIRIPVIAS